MKREERMSPGFVSQPGGPVQIQMKHFCTMALGLYASRSVEALCQSALGWNDLFHEGYGLWIWELPGIRGRNPTVLVSADELLRWMCELHAIDEEQMQFLLALHMRCLLGETVTQNWRF